MEVVEKLTKFSHFIPIKSKQKVANITEIHMKEISRLHGVLKAIILDRDPNFTSKF